MIKNIYVRVVLCLLIITVFLHQETAFSEPSGNDQQSKVKVGKDDPFKKLPEKKKTSLVPRRISGITGIEGIVELFIETVTLNSLNAGSLKDATEPLLSEYGRISVDETSNSLIICDTKEHLEKIIAQIHKADKAAIPQQVVTYL